MSKKLILTLIDAYLIAIAYVLSYPAAIEQKSVGLYFHLAPQTLPFILLAKISIFHLAGMYRPIWRYGGTSSVILMIKATLFSSCAVIGVLFFMNIRIVPRSVFFMDGMLTFLLVGGSRFWIRYVREKNMDGLWPWNFMALFSKKKFLLSPDARRILIYGAGDAGELMLREFIQNTQLKNYHVAGFIDDFKKPGFTIHHCPVLGSLSDLKTLIEKHGVDEIIIAIADLESQKMRQVVTQCRSLNVRFKVIPRLGDIVNNRIQSSQLRDVDISDLLKRPPKNLDHELIHSLIEGKRVLITGAGGSIGSELCYQVASRKPDELIIVEKNEHNLYQISTQLQDKYPGLLISKHLLSVTNQLRLEKIFEEKKPHIVFHAAAYKHVPVCEENICESVINNVQGVMAVSDAAEKFGCEKFIFISTDKAVKPSSVMGATKRLGEMYVQGKDSSKQTRFITVRFGNVLESSGSVVPRFKAQIRSGGPVTVTHPKVTRYLMLLEEAVQLILQAAGMGKGGEVFVLDMGEPIRILDMARDLISLMGLRPDKDIQIEFSTLRPGEKLHEELFEPQEGMKRVHPSMMSGWPKLPDRSLFMQDLEKLIWNAYQEDSDSTREILHRLFPTLKFFALDPGALTEMSQYDQNISGPESSHP